MAKSTSSMECPECGREIPAEAPHGICPRCLLSEAATGSHPPRNPSDLASISLEEVAEDFPQLEVLSRIGSGGMGVVYKARHRKLDRLVAVKLIRSPETERDDGFATRFLREARALAKLNHPNIVAVHDFGETGEFYYLIMEFVDGVDLRQAMDGGEYGPEQALSIVPVICEALQFAHDQGILHRDIKPANILLDKNGTVKIADFGLAKFVEKGEMLTGLTHAEATLGTPAYMAPEQMEKPDLVDHRADIYSLGVVLYEMLTGELPLGKFPEPSKKSKVNSKIDGVVMRTLEKEPAERYQSAREMGSEVEHASSAGLEVGPDRQQTVSGNSGSDGGATHQLESETPSIHAVGNSEETRFSWLGLIGTLLVVPGVLMVFGLMAFLFLALSQKGGGIGFPELLILLGIAGLPGLIATILGGMELDRVRRDGVRPRGMGLAWIAAATWPLLALILLGIVTAVVSLRFVSLDNQNSANILVISGMLAALVSGIGLACLLIGKARRWVYRLPDLSKNARVRRMGLVALFLLFPVLVPMASNLIGKPSSAQWREVLERGDSLSFKELLKSGLDPNSVDENGRTALMYVAERGDSSMTLELLRRGADLSRITDTGENALHFAAKGGNRETVYVMLSDDKSVDFDLRDNNGRTPLSRAAEFGRAEAVELLLDNGASPRSADNEYRSVLSWAAIGGRKDPVGADKVIAILVEAGADVNRMAANGLTPLDHAVINGPDVLIRALQTLGAEKTAHWWLYHLFQMGADQRWDDAIAAWAKVEERIDAGDRRPKEFALGEWRYRIDDLDLTLNVAGMDIARAKGDVQLGGELFDQLKLSGLVSDRSRRMTFYSRTLVGTSDELTFRNGEWTAVERTSSHTDKIQANFESIEKMGTGSKSLSGYHLRTEESRRNDESSGYDSSTRGGPSTFWLK